MAEKRRLNLAFSLSQPRQRAAWRALSAIPAGQRTDAVCRALQERRERRELLEDIRSVAREELSRVQLQPNSTEETRQAEAVDADVIGFLLSLQEGDDMT